MSLGMIRGHTPNFPLDDQKTVWPNSCAELTPRSKIYSRRLQFIGNAGGTGERIPNGVRPLQTNQRPHPIRRAS